MLRHVFLLQACLLATLALPAQQKVTSLQAVTVKGERKAVRYQGDKITLQVAGNNFYKTAVNVMDILLKAPGITGNPDGTLQVSGRNAPTVFVDGKPLPMSAEEQQHYLNSLPPDQVASIDIIAHPSSRYDGQYQAIIDIRLKRNGSLGWQGNVSASYRQNAYAYSDNSGQLAFKTPKWAYTLRANYVRGTSIHTYEALQHQANTNYMATNTMNRHRWRNVNVQPAIEYAVGKDQMIELSGKTYRSDRRLGSFNTLHFTDAARENTVGATESINQATPSQQHNAVNVSYDGRFGKHRLNVFGAFSKIKNRQKEDIRNSDQPGGNLADHWKTVMANDITLRSMQADYTGTLPAGTLEAGAKFAFITTRNDLRYDTLNGEGNFVMDPRRTHQFLYDEYISAAYVSYERKWDAFTARFSLRTEHTYTRANAVTLHAVRKRNYLTWLPAAGLLYRIDANQQAGLSFTRRITRPRFDQLNPFRFYLSPLNYWEGNPYLQPSVTSSLNLSYSNGDLNVALSAGREEDPMTRYPEYNRETNELQYLGKNLPYRDFANIETGYAFAVTKWWKTNHTAGVYYNKEQTPYHGVTYAIGIIDYTINGSQVFSLPGGIMADLSYYYKSKSGDGLYVADPTMSINIGVQKNWSGGKLNTKLNFYDLFDTNVTARTFREKQIIDNRFTHRFGNRRLVATVAYSFGKANYKSRQTRTTDEEKRAGN